MHRATTPLKFSQLCKRAQVFLTVILWTEAVPGRHSNNKLSSSNNNRSNNKFCTKARRSYPTSTIPHPGEGLNRSLGMARGNICTWVDTTHRCKTNRILAGLCNKEPETLSRITKARNIRSIATISFSSAERSHSMRRIKANLCMVRMLFKLLPSPLARLPMPFTYQEATMPLERGLETIIIMVTNNLWTITAMSLQAWHKRRIPLVTRGRSNFLKAEQDWNCLLKAYVSDKDCLVMVAEKLTEWFWYVI